jgi:hypothetical protein
VGGPALTRTMGARDVTKPSNTLESKDKHLGSSCHPAHRRHRDGVWLLSQ